MKKKSTRARLDQPVNRNGSMFGMPCYLANSDIAEVGYRGDHVDAAATQQMRVIVGQLLLMVKNF